MTRNLTEALADFAPAGPAEARVGAFLAHNRHRLAAWSLDDIADAAGVSQPTVTRAVLRLGYRNALELRTAAALVDCADQPRPGRLTSSEVRRAAQLIAAADDLYIYPAPELVPHAEALFGQVFRKTRVDLPMKPQLRRPRDVPVRAEPCFESADVVLVLALAEPPAGHNLLSLMDNAREAGARILVLQSSDIPWEGSALTLSLKLSSETHPQLAALLVAAAAAEIRMEADQLNAANRG